MKKILPILLMTMLYAQLSFADAYIKLMCDESNGDVYVDGEIIGTYDDMPLEFILPPGQYRLEIKKSHNDESYGYYEKTIKAGNIDIKVPINASLETIYPESYYYKNANSIEGAKRYLEVHPNGKYAQKIKNFIELEHVKNADSIEGANRYLDLYPNGKYAQKIKSFIESEYAKKANSIEGAEEYLSRYPEGGFSQEAKKKLQTLKENAEMERVLLSEKKAYSHTTTVSGMEQYISSYPDNPKTNELKNRLGERYYLRIKGLPTAYLMLEPGVQRNIDITEPMIVLQYAVKYLNLFPNGVYADELREKDYFLVKSKKIVYPHSTKVKTFEYTDNFTMLSGEKVDIDSGIVFRNYNGESQKRVPKYKKLYLDYDETGRLTRMSGFYNITYDYQGDRLVRSRQHPRNPHYTYYDRSYEYDSNGLLVKEKYIKKCMREDSNKIRKKKGYKKFSYDENGNLIKIYEKTANDEKVETNYTYTHYTVGR